MENKIEPISLELSQNLRDFISEQERLRNGFWDYANKVIGIPKEKLGQPKGYSDYQKKIKLKIMTHFLPIIISILSFIGGFCFGKASGIKRGIRIGNQEMVEKFQNVFPKTILKR